MSGVSGPNQVPVPLPRYHRRARRDSLPGVVVVADGHLKEVGITLEHPLLYLLWPSNRIIRPTPLVARHGNPLRRSTWTLALRIRW